jgi:hypothetical protein
MTTRSKSEGPGMPAVPETIPYGENVGISARIRNIDSKMDYRSTSLSILCLLSIENLSIYAA